MTARNPLQSREGFPISESLTALVARPVECALCFICTYSIHERKTKVGINSKVKRRRVKKRLYSGALYSSVEILIALIGSLGREWRHIIHSIHEDGVAEGWSRITIDGCVCCGA